MKIIQTLTKHYEGQDNPYSDLVHDLHRDKQTVANFNAQELYDYLGRYPFAKEPLIEMYEELDITVNKDPLRKYLA